MQEFKLQKLFNWQTASNKLVKKYVADLRQSNTSTTSGSLVVGVEYIINTLQPGDNFTNVGFVSTGSTFVATSTTPTVWTHSTEVINVKDSSPVATELFNNSGISFTYEYYGEGVYAVTSSQPIFSNCGMGCAPGQKNQVTISNPISFFGGPAAAIAIFPVANNVIIIITSNGSGYIDNILGDYQQNAIELTLYP